MQKLNRDSIAAPACLATFHYSKQTWNDVRSEDKEQIRIQLEQMQGRRCSYCEGPLATLGQHIEHFRRKRLFPALTFAWGNLYWSCDQPDSCGHYKDNGAEPYNVNDLVEPCADDPDLYFRFRTDGTISIRPGLSAEVQRKAEETLRVFNLHPDWGRLRNMRKAAVSPYVSLVGSDMEFSEDELQELLSDELTQAVTLPFYTAIRHVLTEPY